MHKIKRYANRKLYDATDKKYITLDQLSKLIKSGEEITVTDNKTGKDLTAATLSQILARDKKGKTDEVASGVVVQLLRKGPGTLVDYGKRYVSLWDRALTMADEEIDRLVDRLVKEKEITRSEGSRFKREITERARDLKGWIGERIDQRIKEALSIMNLATREQAVDLRKKVEALTKKVEKLEKAITRKAEEEKAKVLLLKAEAEKEQTPDAEEPYAASTDGQETAGSGLEAAGSEQ